MKNRAILTVATVLLMSLLASYACGGPAPSPTPTTKAHEPVHINIVASEVGSEAYVLSHTISILLGKTGSWLSADAVEGGGSTARIKVLIERPEKRKDTIIVALETTVNLTQRGLYPFDKPYDGARVIATYQYSPVTLATYDKNIKTIADFKGKRVMNVSRTFTAGLALQYMFEKTWAIMPDIRYSEGDWSGSARALRDGTADIAAVSGGGMPGDKFRPIPAWHQLLQEKPGLVYPTVITKKDVQAAAEGTGMVDGTFAWLEGNMWEPPLPGPFAGWGNTSGWWCDKSMDEDIVYEFCRIIYENVDKFKEVLPSTALVGNKIGMMPVPEDMFHPGALRFYKEHKLPIGYKPS